MIDIGINLFNKQFSNDKEDVINNAINAGVEQMILTGTSTSNSIQSAKLAEQFPNRLFSTAGVHPHNAKEYTEKTNESLLKLLQLPQVVAVGECGLDFDRNFSTKEEQYFAFENQIALSEKTTKPLFLHEREAHDSFVSIMKQYSHLAQNSVVHCFTSNKTHLKNYLDLGFYIGITGWVCDERRGKDLREAISYLPLESLLIETDSPFLKPKSLISLDNSRRNEPKYLKHIANTIAAIKNVPIETVIDFADNNTKKLFKL